MESYIFYILALIIISFAIASVTSRRMLRSVIYLLFVLVGIAGIYFMADFNFLAAIQLTVYAGGIIVLIIFSVFLVHHIDTELEVAGKSKRVITAITCLVGLGVFLTTIYSHPFKAVPNKITTTTADIGRLLLSFEDGGFVLPFEVISVLLLAVMIGAIYIGKGGGNILPGQSKLSSPIIKEKSGKGKEAGRQKKEKVASDQETNAPIVI